MMWLVGKTCVLGSTRHKKLVLLACRIAEDALKFVPKNEQRPAKAIEVARRWVRGLATLDEVRIAYSAASYATSAASYAASAASSAAYAASAASYAAYAAYSAASYAAQKTAMQKYAKWVREEFPNPPRIRKGTYQGPKNVKVK